MTEPKINKAKVFLMLAVILIVGLVILDSSFQSLFEDENTQAVPEKLEKEKQEEKPTSSLLKQHNCFSCHEVDKVNKAPSFISISRKFRDEKSAPELLIKKVIRTQMFVDHFEKGGGKDEQMFLLNSKASPRAEIEEMILWILSLRMG